MKLADVAGFVHSPDFSAYRKWFEMYTRMGSDASLRLSQEELASLEDWPRIRDLHDKVLPEAVKVHETFHSTLAAEAANFARVTKDLENKNKLFAFYKSVLESLTKLYLDSLSSMLTEVYQEVFNVASKKVLLQMVDYRNKKIIKLSIVAHAEDGHDYIEDFSFQGGSARMVLGIVVAIYFLLTTGGERIIFIDESFSSLHDDVLQRFLAILRQFVDNLGFTFVMIDHSAYRFKGFIDKVFLVNDGVYKEMPADSFFSLMDGGSNV
jgi:ABC-type dipeptide/oligopeptide/nickel transport system ATPase component